jgi:hypothetical protein
MSETTILPRIVVKPENQNVERGSDYLANSLRGIDLAIASSTSFAPSVGTAITTIEMTDGYFSGPVGLTASMIYGFTTGYQQGGFPGAVTGAATEGSVFAAGYAAGTFTFELLTPFGVAMGPPGIAAVGVASVLVGAGTSASVKYGLSLPTDPSQLADGTGNINQPGPYLSETPTPCAR